MVQVSRVDSDGAFSFDNVPAGSLLLYAFAHNYRMSDASNSRVILQGGQDWTAAVRMMEDEIEMYDHRIQGRVTDATTGAPVAGAWIAATSLAEAGNSVRYLVENTGTTLTVSDENGYYSMQAYGVPEYWEGPIIGLSPISCARNGYRSRTYAGEGPDFAYEDYLPGGLLPAPADSVLVLDISLEPVPVGGLPAAAVGTVRGIVLHDGQPQEGVMVNLTLMALADRDTVFDPADKVAVDGGFVLSGEDGSYEFKVEPGFYAIRAGLLPDDGWCRASGTLPDLEVVAGEVTEIGPLSMGRAIKPLSPLPGAVVSGQQIRLSWTSVAGAEYYRISGSINTTYSYDLGTTNESEFNWTAPALDPGQPHLVRWKVFAIHTVEEMTQNISWFETPATFTIEAESQ